MTEQRRCESCRRYLPLSEFRSTIVKRQHIPTQRCQRCRDAQAEADYRQHTAPLLDPAPPPHTRIYAAVCLMCARQEYLHLLPRRAWLLRASGLLKRCARCYGQRYLEEATSAGPGSPLGAKAGHRYDPFMEVA